MRLTVQNMAEERGQSMRVRTTQGTTADTWYSSCTGLGHLLEPCTVSNTEGMKRVIQVVERLCGPGGRNSQTLCAVLRFSA